MFALILSLSFSMLFGCAPPQFIIPSDKTEADYKRDLYDCEYKARLLYRESIGVPFEIGPHGVRLAVREEWKRCMESRGYTYVQE